MLQEVEIPHKPPRKFLPEDLDIESWESVQTYYESLRERQIDSIDELLQWLSDRSELEAVMSEDAGWRYIRMSIDTTDDNLLERYKRFVSEIHPETAPFVDAFNKKLVGSSLSGSIVEEGFDIYLRSVRKSLELYREVNVPLLAEITETSQQFGAISGAQTITYRGEELTMQKSATFLSSTDREERETVYRMMVERRLEDRNKLNDLFDSLLGKRHQVALNADFKNFRDYKFQELGRFDYSVQDCFRFHDSIANELVPVLKQLHLERKDALGVDVLRPWDTEVDVKGRQRLQPFKDGSELITRTIALFDTINPTYGNYLRVMQRMGHLDLESKNGKMPGGYNYPLYEIGVPFIFMNAVGLQQDLVTMVHEGGHAIHSFLTRDLNLTPYKSLPSEVAELASMSMELISMEHWDVIYEDENDLRRAKRDQLQKLFMILPWIATVDAFQHWLYENPNHTREERDAMWLEIMERYSTGVVDYSGLELAKATAWQRQLHIYEVPFYYIEYGMAQLGAIAVWRNYKKNPKQALEQYEAALKLGYTKSIPQIYETAGIRFDFSREYVRELMGFVQAELDSL